MTEKQFFLLLDLIEAKINIEINRNSQDFGNREYSVFMDKIEKFLLTLKREEDKKD